MAYMLITSHILEAFLKCPTKCWLKSAGEQIANVTCTQFGQSRDELYRRAEILRLLSKTPNNASVIAPTVDIVKTGKWRLVVNVHAQTAHLDSYLHAVEHVPFEGRGNVRSSLP